MKKNFLKYAMTLLAVVAGMVSLDSCEKEPQEIVIVDQFDYNSQVSEINSVVYLQKGDGYHFYISPSENISSIEGMEKADDYLFINVENPSGKIDESSDYSVIYKAIDLNKDNVSEVASEFSLHAELKSENLFILHLILKTNSGTTLRAEYDGECIEEKIGLSDQIYNGTEKRDIRSAVFEVNNDLYDFYFSPNADISDVDGMKDNDDYLKISVKNPDGVVDTESETFEVIYEKEGINVSVSDKTAIKEISLSAKESNKKVTLSLNLMTVDGKTLFVHYDNTAIKELVDLSDQFELDEAVEDIDIIKEVRDVKEGMNRYFVYAQGDAATPAIEIWMASDMSGTIDLAGTDARKVGIKCGGFNTSSGAEGTLLVELVTDKFDKIQGISLQIDATVGSQRLRADYDNAVECSYASENILEITEGSETSTSTLEKVFRKEPHSAGHLFAFGDINENLSAPEDLMNGHYALKFSVTPNAFGKVIDLEESSADYSFELYDYTTYSTYDKDEIESGTIETYSDPHGDDGIVYISLNITLTNGIVVKAEYYGQIMGVTEEFDITPIEPFSPKLVITDKDGEVIFERDLSSMQVRKELGYKWHGGAEYGGATFDAYSFYFLNDQDVLSGSIDYQRSVVPMLVLPASVVDAAAEYDLANPTDPLPTWSFEFQRGELSRPNYGNTYESYGMTTRQCPDEVVVKAVRNEDKTWDFYFRLKDYGAFNSWNASEKSGTENIITIEWKGKATKYTGSNKNDLMDDYYE